MADASSGSHSPGATSPEAGDGPAGGHGPHGKQDPLGKKPYKKELRRLRVELSRMQRWVIDRGRRIVVLFEGRDAAGKGGTIKRIVKPLNNRFCRVVALDKPTEREQTQWYFQRYVPHLPAAGEIVLFDRSWYNRAGVERVMGFCTDAEYHNFLRSCPLFERLLVYEGITLVKYWFSVSADEQERRLQARIDDPTKRWKLSQIDLSARSRWADYSQAKDQMFTYTDTPLAPWFVVPSDDKRRARLNCMAHLLSLVDYEVLPTSTPELPPKQANPGYVRPPETQQRFVPDVTEALE
jgi:polyphosphate kinase 2